MLMKCDMSLLENAFPLVIAEQGEWLEIVGVTGGKAWEKSLAAMGLVSGAKIQLCSDDKELGAVVCHEGRRIALGKSLIYKVMVKSTTTM